MKKLMLSKGKYALIDDEDYAFLNNFNWKYHTASGYAYRNKSKGRDGQRGGIIFMHRTINNTPKGMEVDHINRDKLDNRKENMRNCFRVHNSRNRSGDKNTSSRHKGVHFKKQYGTFEATITVDGKRIYLGRFGNEDDAAKKYNKAAMEYFGEYAYLNAI